MIGKPKKKDTVAAATIRMEDGTPMVECQCGKKMHGWALEGLIGQVVECECGQQMKIFADKE